MKNLKSIAMLGALMALSADSTQRGDYMPDLTTPRKEPPIPKGCKVYWFTQAGEMSFTEPPHPIVSHRIIALNEKSERRKFKNLDLAF